MIASVRCMWLILVLISIMSVTFREAESTFHTVPTPKNDISFYLYTRRNPTWPQQFFPSRGGQMLDGTYFDSNKPTFILTHGWLSSAESPSCTLIRDAYLNNVDGNVMIVDLTWITSNYGYFMSAMHVQSMGQYVASVIDNLSWNRILDTSKTTLVGHSLGAHVMGLAGYYSRATIKRIIGLDPSKLGFDFLPPEKRISTLDAEYVQIIHTNGNFLGTMKSMGHADFYPNGGRSQPGCLFDIMGVCSHKRAFEFFAESINPRAIFRGYYCNDLDAMTSRRCYLTNNVMGGLYSEPRGIYYVETNPTFPYARG